MSAEKNKEKEKEKDKDELDTTSFWSSDPNVLLYAVELYPASSMSFEQKLNAITRGVIVLSIIALIWSLDIRFLIVLMFTILVQIIKSVFLVSSKCMQINKFKLRS